MSSTVSVRSNANSHWLEAGATTVAMNTAFMHR